ncbi:MAG: hypothetical protein ACOVO0_15030, partial [Burkholderiaceae bacterium]
MSSFSAVALKLPLVATSANTRMATRRSIGVYCVNLRNKYAQIMRFIESDYENKLRSVINSISLSGEQSMFRTTLIAATLSLIVSGAQATQ